MAEKGTPHLCVKYTGVALSMQREFIDAKRVQRDAMEGLAHCNKGGPGGDRPDQVEERVVPGIIMYVGLHFSLQSW